MDKRIFGIPPILREGESISTHCLQACQGIAMREEIERLRQLVIEMGSVEYVIDGHGIAHHNFTIVYRELE